MNQQGLQRTAEHPDGRIHGNCRATIVGLEAELAAARATIEELSREDTAFLRGVAAVDTIRCVEHQSVRQQNDKASGSECGICAREQAEAELAAAREQTRALVESSERLEAAGVRIWRHNHQASAGSLDCEPCAAIQAFSAALAAAKEA